jgi:hypothetical protein
MFSFSKNEILSGLAFMKPEVRYRGHKSLPPDAILMVHIHWIYTLMVHIHWIYILMVHIHWIYILMVHIHWIYILTPRLFQIHFHITLFMPVSFKWSLPVWFSDQTSPVPISPTCLLTCLSGLCWFDCPDLNSTNDTPHYIVVAIVLLIPVS